MSEYSFPPTSMDELRVLFVLDASAHGASVRVRALRYRPMFEAARWNVHFVDVVRDGYQMALDLAPACDLVYVVRAKSVSFIRRVRQVSRAKIILDFGDSLWRSPHREFWPNLNHLLACSDAVFSVTSYDAEYASRFNRLVIPLPPSVPMDIFDTALAKRPERPPIPIVLGWVGSESTIQALHLISPALDAIGRRHPKTVLRVVGCDDRSKLPKLLHMKLTSHGSYNDIQMANEIVAMDIGLFPPALDEDDFCVRGPQKALLYMAGRVASISLRAGDCAKIIHDGINGMLAIDLQDWENKMEILVTDSILRHNIGIEGNKLVRDKYNLNCGFSQLTAALQKVAVSPSGASCPARPFQAFVERIAARFISENKIVRDL